MLEQNIAEFKKSGIMKWHERGYTGKGVTIVVLDDNSKPHDWANVELPFNHHRDKIGHKTNVCSVVRECLPDARIIAFNWFGTDKGRISDWLYKNEEIIDVINCSFTSPDKDAFERLKYLDIPIVCAAGNRGGRTVDFPASLDWTIAVGALEEYHDKIADYSNRGKKLDCVAFTNIYIPNSKKKPIEFNGTSCAAPMVASMLGIYIEWRKRNGLHKLGRDEAREFIHQNCIDYGEKGFDEVYGHGLFVLPDEFWKEGEPEVNNPEYIIIHHSATAQGNAETFRKAHKAKGWRDIGYHYVIGNGTYSGDGEVEPGRPENESGAHCSADGMNFKSIGICLVGNFDIDKPTPAQMETLEKLCRDIMAQYKIPVSKVLGHGEVKGAATNCPGRHFNMAEFRKRLEGGKVAKDYEGHWAQQYIEKAINAGYMAGYPDGSFKPDNPITRAEFCRVLSFIIDKLERR